jgi:hypothetical protein
MNKLLSPARIPNPLRKLFWLLALVALSVPLAVNSSSRNSNKDSSEDELEKHFTDLRTFVKMPERARQILQEDMLDHLAVLNEINRYLSEDKLSSAAEVAETGMGQSLLSKYQDEEMRPGHYMPQAMREIGWELHNAATEFTKVAREGDLKQTLVAYHRITSACVACHYSYRTR